MRPAKTKPENNKTTGAFLALFACGTALLFSPDFKGLSINSAHAQTIPAAALPGRTEEKPPTLPELFPPQPSTTTTQETSIPLPVPPDTLFHLNTVVFEGATAYSPEELQAWFSDSTGKDIPAQTISTILGQIQKTYYEDGYAISAVTAPRYDGNTGTLTVHITEGFIDTIEFDPALPAESAVLKGFAKRLRDARILNTRQLERLLLLVNDMAGTEIEAVLAPREITASPTTNTTDNQGALTLLIRPRNNANNSANSNAIPHIANGYISANNTGSRYAGPTRLGAGISFANAGFAYAGATLDATTTLPTHEVKQASATYTLPLWNVSGLSLTLSGDASHTHPGYTLDEYEVKGRSNTLALRIDYAMIRQRSHNWFTGLSFSYKNTDTDLLYSPLFRDRLRTIAFDTRYSFADTLFGNENAATNFAFLQIGKGLDLLNASRENATDLSRTEGNPQAFKANATLSRDQNLPLGLNALIRLEGQYTPSPLLASEEFGFGGSTLGRGYDPAEITGDTGVALSLELRRTIPLEEYRLAIQPYAFYDIGKVWNIDPSQKNDISAASTGFGLRLNTQNGLSADTSIAIPLTKPADPAPTYGNGGSPRFLVQISKSF